MEFCRGGKTPGDAASAGLLLCEACRCAIGFGCTQLEAACSRHRTEAHRFYQSAGMCDSHQKFVLTLTESNILLPDTGK